MNSIYNIIYQTLISSQAWVAFCIALLTLFMQQMLGLHEAKLVWFVFFSTLFAYNLAYWVIDYQINYRLIIMVLSAMISLFLYWTLDEMLIKILLLFAGIVSILYSFPIHPNQEKTLRQLPHIKIILIALVWAIAVNVFILELDLWLFDKFIWSFLGIFCFVMGITIPFDIRDFYTDHDNLQTIPQQFGVKKSKIIAYIMLLLSIPFLYKAVGGYFNAYMVIYLITVIIAMVMIYKQKLTSNKWYIAFWIEGLSALPYIIFKILSYIIS